MRGLVEWGRGRVQKEWRWLCGGVYRNPHRPAVAGYLRAELWAGFQVELVRLAIQRNVARRLLSIVFSDGPIPVGIRRSGMVHGFVGA